MPIQTVIEILKGYEKYVVHMNNHGFDDVIDTIKEIYHSLLITMRGHMGETYEMEVYFSETTGELCIEDAITHISVFDTLNLEEYGITEKLLHSFKYPQIQHT